MYAVAIGGPFDGMYFWGPFQEFEEARYWADRNVSLTWWVVNLLDPQVV
jgi:hypothetical protein